MISAFLNQPPPIRRFFRTGKTPAVESYPSTGSAALVLFHYHAVLTVAQTGYVVAPGGVALLPAGRPRVFDIREPGLHRTVHLQLPLREPRVFDGGDAFPGFVRKFDKAFECHPEAPQRAAAIIWELLWDVNAFLGNTQNDAMDPRVQQAVSYIEAHLQDRLKAADIARAADISHSRLNQLFYARFGLSITRYLLKQRMQAAEYYLTCSAIPIKQIAARVGIPDLQHFNKTLRAYYGRGPRCLREDAK